ncbi:hypothetical protein MVES1_000509 [Malassezia vespertilionis]|uniref:Uncharacterized protein n=1 Tax=Malassezia vespertilionis TaxID=2020962 RepID=A0A2N1JGG1_9BASI|nr:uncharacterized protein MVES1_000509 [Malassezia vespertilionis]PKI85626.1 hypothetical protein MVES_000470 [Malassezia vespertilionis]WFD05183.1 hypothetical protein MVES1_000509 [Malassezia vespertilionis]
MANGAVASPVLGEHKASPVPGGEELQMGTVLLVCLIHDNDQLRERWTELGERALCPLFCALGALQHASSLLVGGVLYRCEPKSELVSLLRPEESIERIPFLPAARFTAHAHKVLSARGGAGVAQLDALDLRRGEMQTERDIADGLAAALEMLDARETQARIAPFARAALAANFPPVLSRYLLHIDACDGSAVPRAPALEPALNMASTFDGMDTVALVAQLNRRPITIGTVVSVRNASARARISVARAMQDMICTRLCEGHVNLNELLGADWRPPEDVEVVLSSAHINKALRKDANGAEEAGPKKRQRSDMPVTAATVSTTPKQDQVLLGKILLLQQRLTLMLKNLGQLAASHNGTALQSQTLEKIKQQLLVQQQAINAQTYRLRTSKQPNFNPILQALITIDKEAREAGIQLHGPGSAPSNARQELKSSATQGSNAQQIFWQGVVRWSASGQVNGESMFTFVVASIANAGNARTQLGLPWPSIMEVQHFLSAGAADLQRMISTHRMPVVLLTLRSLVSNAPVRGAENNERNYRWLAEMLQLNRRVAYIPLGGSGCGILLTPLANLRPQSAGANETPRLLALVSRTPIPFAEMTMSNAATTTATNTRGMVSTAPAMQTVPKDMMPQEATAMSNFAPHMPVQSMTSSMLNASQMLSISQPSINTPELMQNMAQPFSFPPAGVSNTFVQPQTSLSDTLSQLLAQTNVPNMTNTVPQMQASNPMAGSVSLAVPLQQTNTTNTLTAEQLRALGFP